MSFHNHHAHENLTRSKSSVQSFDSDHVLLANVSSAQVHVDCAFGLPVSTTATRMTVNLLSPNRNHIGEPSASCFSHPASDARNPFFDLHYGCDRHSLHASYTFLFRIDSLERPNLAPKRLGYAALKVCVDENEKQPLFQGSSNDSNLVYFNSGGHMLPIVWGDIPFGTISEDCINQLPRIDGAFLKVYLFDPCMSGVDIISELKENIPNSVASSLIKSFPLVKNRIIEKLAVSEKIISEVIDDVPLEHFEKKILIQQTFDWMSRSFPFLKINLEKGDNRFFNYYDDKYGVQAGLDMLLNMPLRTNELVKSSQNDSSLMKNKKAWDNKISCYKSFFRYLPGASTKPNDETWEDNRNLMDCVIDDASLNLIIDSKEGSPAYNDDLSGTIGFKLSINSCLLIVVTAVDVMTSLRKDAPKYTENKGCLKPNKDLKSSKSKEVSGSLSDQNMESEHQRALEDREFKLRGLVGLHIGHDDPDACWWGIVPLLQENPFYKGKTRKKKKKKSNSLNESHDVGIGIVKTNSKISPELSTSNNDEDDDDHDNKVKKREKNTADSDTSDVENRSKRSISKSTSIKRSKIIQESQELLKKLFVNSGTHLIPLFQGLPPEELATVDNPYEWVLQNMMGESGGFLSGFCSCLDGSEISNSITKNGVNNDNPFKYRKGSMRNKLILDPNCAAVVKLVDPRVKQFYRDSLRTNEKLILNDDVLLNVIKAKNSQIKKDLSVKYYKNKCIKEYKQIKYTYEKHLKKMKTLRSYDDAIPSTIFVKSLAHEFNIKFAQNLSDH